MIMIYIFPLVLKMGDDRRRAMYDGFNSDTLGHYDAWVKVADEFVAHTFASEHRVAKSNLMTNTDASDCYCLMVENIITRLHGVRFGACRHKIKLDG
jgi:3-phosphoglycerate kinase